MRHALLILLLPMTMLLSGCCVWWDDDEEVPYHEVRVKNRTDQTVTIHYTAVVNVEIHTDGDDNDYYSYDYKDKTADIPAGRFKDIKLPRESDIGIRAHYGGVEHLFSEDADSLCPCDLGIVMEIEDFIPTVPPPMPMANG